MMISKLVVYRHRWPEGTKVQRCPSFLKVPFILTCFLHLHLDSLRIKVKSNNIGKLKRCHLDVTANDGYSSSSNFPQSKFCARHHIAEQAFKDELVRFLRHCVRNGFPSPMCSMFRTVQRRATPRVFHCCSMESVRFQCATQYKQAQELRFLMSVNDNLPCR